MKRSLSAPRRVDQPIEGSTITGHRRIIGRDVWAWWILGPCQWSFRTTSERESSLSLIAAAQAAAMGHDIHLLVDHTPFDAAGWAADLDEATPDPLPDVPGCDETWAALVNRDQETLAGMTVPVVAVGVRLGVLPRGHNPSDQVPPDLLAVEHGLDERFAGHGLAARPALAREIAWFVNRAQAPGHTVPTLPAWDRWDPAACRAFGDTVKWESTRTGKVVKVTVGRNGDLAERWVAVLTMGRMEPQSFPENGRVPWLAFAQHLTDPKTKRPIPVRVSASGRVKARDESIGSATKWMQRAKAIREHYHEHGEEPPTTVDRTVTHAIEIYDEVTEAPADIAARWEGVIRFSVDAASETEAMSYARMLTAMYSEHQHMWLAQPGGIAEPTATARMLREFSPGVRPDLTGYVREMPVRYLAAGVPNMGGPVGTPGGMKLGVTVGDSPRPVLHDQHYPMRHNQPGDFNNNSGFFGIVGNLGAGKSLILGSLSEHTVRAGIPTRVLDASPGAPLARLCQLPYIAPYAAHIGLGGAQPGTLIPYKMILDPPRLPGQDDDLYQSELLAAAGDRKELVCDTFMQLLPESTRRREDVEEHMRNAVAKAGGAVDTNPWHVLDHLAETLPMVAGALREMAGGVARLMFPAPTPRLIKSVPEGALLTVISTGGLSIPDPDSDRDEWTGRERAAYTALGLAGFLTAQGVYTGDMSAPKAVNLDELRVWAEWRSGRTMIRKLGFDSRKYTASVNAACQDPDVLTALGVGPFLGGVFLGRQIHEDVAVRCMQLAGIDASYARTLLELRTGQWVYRGTFGMPELIQVDRPHDLLFDALNTESVERNTLAVRSS